jgi:hypothetical protein
VPSGLCFAIVRVCATVHYPYWTLSASFKSQDEVFVRGKAVTPLVFTIAIEEQSTVLHLVIAGNQGLVNSV